MLKDFIACEYALFALIKGYKQYANEYSLIVAASGTVATFFLMIEV